MPTANEQNVSGDVRQYFKGLTFPALKHDVVHAARQNGAPSALVANLEQVPRTTFDSAEQVVQLLQS